MDVQLSAMGSQGVAIPPQVLSGCSGSLSLNILREVYLYLKDLLLSQVTPHFLRSFNSHTSAWGPQVPLSVRIQADDSSTWVVLEDSKGLFCSGGGND